MLLWCIHDAAQRHTVGVNVAESMAVHWRMKWTALITNTSDHRRCCRHLASVTRRLALENVLALMVADQRSSIVPPLLALAVLYSLSGVERAQTPSTLRECSSSTTLFF